MKHSRSFLSLIAALALTPVIATAQSIIINGQTFPLDTSQPVSVDPGTGDISVTTQDPVVCSVGGDPASISSFSLDPIVASQGDGNVTVQAFYTTTDATSCTGTSDSSSFLLNSDWDDQTLLTQSAGGEQAFQVNVDNLSTGSYTLTLQCSNAAGSDSATATFDVAEAQTGDCAGTAPTNLTRDTAIIPLSSDETTTFASIWGDFPGANTNNWRIRNGQYAALEFSTVGLSSNAIGQVSIQSGPDNPLGPHLYSISECPGDFGPNVPTNCRKVVDPAQQEELVWAMDPFSVQCDLEPNKTYYFNMVPAINLPSTRNPQWACGTDSNGQPVTNASFCAGKGTAREF
ncbi:MAG: hypothetical protein ACNS61_06370 [Candidatus Wenzhouxiangella sp. M2_3B_020]